MGIVIYVMEIILQMEHMLVVEPQPHALKNVACGTEGGITWDVRTLIIVLIAV